MAITFLQDDIDLTNEELKEFIKNIDGEEFSISDLGVFSFRNDGFIEREDEKTGLMIYVLEDIENEYFYLLKLNYYYTDHYDIFCNQHDSTLYSISKSDSLNY